MADLKNNDKAPYFEGLSQDGEMIKLSDYSGKKLILYFYPKDNTPGCTAESCDLNDNYEFWLQNGFHIVGVSPDNVQSHRKFADKFGFKFKLIADTNTEILKAYDAWGEKSMYGKKYMGVLRKTFIINEEGIIVEIIEKVQTKDHTQQISSLLKI